MGQAKSRQSRKYHRSATPLDKVLIMVGCRQQKQLKASQRISPLGAMALYPDFNVAPTGMTGFVWWFKSYEKRTKTVSEYSPILFFWYTIKRELGAYGINSTKLIRSWNWCLPSFPSQAWDWTMPILASRPWSTGNKSGYAGTGWRPTFYTIEKLFLAYICRLSHWTTDRICHYLYGHFRQLGFIPFAIRKTMNGTVNY